MITDAIRQLYEYHFAQNRSLWTSYIVGLPQDQFIQPSAYSIGSVRDQLVHLMSVDYTWFSSLRGLEIPDMLNPAHFDDRDMLRARWDTIEQEMRAYLATLHDELLFSKPFPEGEDEALTVWHALMQVINHGTDHRAQILRLLHDLGVKTGPQDYIFYVYDHLH